MRKLMAVLICMLLLSPAVSASETKYAALIVTGGPNGAATEKMLEGLAARDAKANFFLRGEQLSQFPALAERMASEGHELALEGYSAGSMVNDSRRKVAKSFADTRALLPKGSYARFLRPPEGEYSDAVRQVAEVTGLAMIHCKLDIRGWAAKDSTIQFAPMVELVADGDLVMLSDATAASVNASLAMVDRLRQEGFRFVTLSELARRRGVLIHPGRLYTAFPPETEE